MGRPPIGKQAMSAAERQRRHREKFRDSEPITKPSEAKAFRDSEPVTKPTTKTAPLEARIRELEAELAKFRDSVTVTKSSAKPVEIDLSEAPKTWRQKFEAAERRRQKEFDLLVEQRAQEIWRERIADYLPELQARQKKYNEIINRHKGIWPRPVFLKILKCLHTDTARNVSDKMLDEAFIALKEREHVLVARESPIPETGLPRNWQEMEAARETVRARNSARAKAAWEKRKAKAKD